MKILGGILKYTALITVIFFLPSVFYLTGFFFKQVLNDATDISFVVSKEECCKGFCVEPTNYSFGDFCRLQTLQIYSNCNRLSTLILAKVLLKLWHLI
ncbi:hypothetical protein L3X38_003722 [Prunus dulcis]|uniref:Uncharacterized protein n=1 Tax=Prunus dulcis TaxID=3755 RepID=A0AAD4ZMM2_PRUDU|nr:hypothetical protein L3X38_003722 [Prunus dulcis]